MSKDSDSIFLKYLDMFIDYKNNPSIRKDIETLFDLIDGGLINFKNVGKDK